MLKFLFFLLNLLFCLVLFWLNLNKILSFEDFARIALDHHYTRHDAFHYFELDRPFMFWTFVLPLPLTLLWLPLACRNWNPWLFVPYALAAAPLVVYCALATVFCATGLGFIAAALASVTSIFGVIFLVEAAAFVIFAGSLKG